MLNWTYSSGDMPAQVTLAYQAWASNRVTLGDGAKKPLSTVIETKWSWLTT